MLKKSVKYLLILVGNLALLCFLLLSWFDELELINNSILLIFELFRIVLFAGLSLLLSGVVRLCISTPHNRIKTLASVITTIITSSYLYGSYFIHIYENRIIWGKTRKEIIRKSSYSEQFGKGIKTDSLTLEEYNYISNHWTFPAIPKEAKNISFFFSKDDLLPDYYLLISYDVPKNIEIESIKYKQDNFYKNQTVETKESYKRVRYEEILQ